MLIIKQGFHCAQIPSYGTFMQVLLLILRSGTARAEIHLPVCVRALIRLLKLRVLVPELFAERLVAGR